VLNFNDLQVQGRLESDPAAGIFQIPSLPSEKGIQISAAINLMRHPLVRATGMA
jgi:hypothetical protein